MPDPKPLVRPVRPSYRGCSSSLEPNDTGQGYQARRPNTEQGCYLAQAGHTYKGYDFSPAGSVQQAG